MGLPEDMVRELIERQLADYMQKCQHIIVPSPSIKKMIEDTYGIRTRVTVIPTGIDLKPYQQANGRPIRRKHGWRDDQKIVVSIGRLAAEKFRHPHRSNGDCDANPQKCAPRPHRRRPG